MAKLSRVAGLKNWTMNSVSLLNYSGKRNLHLMIYHSKQKDYKDNENIPLYLMLISRILKD